MSIPTDALAPLLVASNIDVDYLLPIAERTRQHRTFRAVSDVSLTLAPGGRVGIVGESGSGKSTLARVLAGLQRPRAGSVTIDAAPRTRPRRSGRSANPAQMIFQDPAASLNPRMTVQRTIQRALLHSSAMSKTEQHDAVTELLADVGLGAEFLDRYPTQMSGGQRQRVAIARALAADPAVIVADEPTSALDVSVQAVVLARIDRIIAERGLGLIFVTHDLGVVRAVADRVLVMYHGQVVEEGDVVDVIDRPQHPYTRALLSAVPSPSRPGDHRLQLRSGPTSPAERILGCRFHPRCPFVLDRCASEEPPLATYPDGHRSRCWLGDSAMTPVTLNSNEVPTR